MNREFHIVIERDSGGATTWPLCRHCRAATPRPGRWMSSPSGSRRRSDCTWKVAGETSEVLDYVGTQRVTIAS